MNILQSVEQQLNKILNQPEILKTLKQKNSTLLLNTLKHFMEDNNEYYRYEISYDDNKGYLEPDFYIFIRDNRLLQHKTNKEYIYDLNFELLVSDSTIKCFVQSVDIFKKYDDNYTERKAQTKYDVQINYECLLSHWRYTFSRYDTLYHSQKTNSQLFLENELYLNYEERNVENKKLYNPIFQIFEKLHSIYKKEQKEVNELIINHLNKNEPISQEGIELIQITHDIDLQPINELYKNSSYRFKSLLI